MAMSAASSLVFCFAFFLHLAASLTHRVRLPSISQQASDCRATLCAGPAVRYPANANMSFYAEYTIPPLPKQFSPQQTYYIYYNIYFGDSYGKFNQFVPQLMLGSALCGSSNAPDYIPKFANLKQWYIGSQYFFALYNESDQDGWSGYAATGDLIDVYEGDIVYTSFQFHVEEAAWSLTMGIKGNETAVSIVNASKPYMGLIPNTTAWTEDVYNETSIGCCWELYDIQDRNEYPLYMDYQIVTKSTSNGSAWWKPWKMTESPNCSYSPTWSLDSGVSSDDTQQITFFDIFYN